MPAQGLLRAGHGQHHGDPGEAGEGEAPPVPAALEQDHRLPQQPGDDGQRGEPDQQQHDQQQPVGGRLAGGSGDRLAGGGLPAVARRQGGWSGSCGTSGAQVAGAAHVGQRVDLDGMAGPDAWPAGRSGSRRPRAGRSRRSGSSGHAGAGSRPPAAGRRPCGSARPRPRPAWAGGRRPRRTGPAPAAASGSSGSWMAPSGTWLLPASRRSSRSDSQRPPAGMLGSRARRTTPTAWTWASWGMTKDQARTSRPTSRSALAVGATHRWPRRRSRATRPRSSQRSSTSRRVASPSWPSTRGSRATAGPAGPGGRRSGRRTAGPASAGRPRRGR